MAFRDLTPARALSVARQKQRTVAVAPLWEGPSLGKGERIVRFDSPNSAVVATAGTKKRSRIEAVGSPMAAGPTAGQPADASDLKPIDLSLNATEQGWSPERSAVATVLPRDTGGRITVGEELTVGLDHADGAAAGTRTAETKVFYAALATDTDAFVEPVSDGVSVSWLLRSPAAPERLRFDIDGASASGIRVQDDGSLTLHGAEGPVGGVSAPQARDADGTLVTTRFVVEGDQVSVAVDHRGRDLAYPIAVDPVIRPAGAAAVVLEQEENPNGPSLPMGQGWVAHTFQPPLFSFFENGSAHSITTSGTGDGSAWFAFNPIRNSAPYRVQFANVEHLRQGPGSGTCQKVGIYSPSSFWAASSAYAYWTGDYAPGGATPWNTTPPPGPTGQGSGAFEDCSGTRPRSFVQVCAISSCQPVGASENVVAFQVNAAQVQAGAWSWSSFAGAYIYHRENVAPTATVTPSWIPAAWDAFDEDSTIGVVAHDDGVGLCGDAGNGFPPVVVVKDSAVASQVLGSAGNDGCTGMTYDRPAPSDQSYEVSVAGGTVAEGIRQLWVTTTDAVGNAKLNILQARVDRSAPIVTLSGDLYGQRDTQIPVGGQRPLTVAATDGSTASATTQRSGVQRIEVYIDDELVKTQEQTVAGDSKSLSTGWTPGADTFTAGDYTVRVVVTDRVGNDQEQEFVVHAACCSSALDDGTVPVGDRLHEFGDATGDGIADLILVDTASGAIAVANGNGDGTFENETSWGTFGTAIDKIAVGDIDGDRDADTQSHDEAPQAPVAADLVARATSGALLVRLSNATVFDTPPPSDLDGLQNSWPSDRTLGLADVDGDGTADLWGVDAGTRALRVAYSDGDAFQDSASWLTVPASRDVDMADLDGDGQADLVTYEPSDGAVRYHQSHGDAFDNVQTWDPGPTSADLATGDINGDGLDDVLFRKAAVAGQVPAVVGYSSSRYGGFVGGPKDLGSLSAAYRLSTRDLTGDDRSDVVGTRVENGNLLIRSSASVVPEPDEPDTSPLDPDDPALAAPARTGPAAAAAPGANATLMMSDDSNLLYGNDLNGNSSQALMDQMSYLGAKRIRLFVYWGQIDRLHPDDRAGLKLAPGAQPAAQTDPAVVPSSARRFLLARDENPPQDQVDKLNSETAADLRPEWINGEWRIIEHRYYLAPLRRVFGQVVAHNQAPTPDLSMYLTFTGGTRDWTECSRRRDPEQLELRVRGCAGRPDELVANLPAPSAGRPTYTGLNPDPAEFGHVAGEVVERMRQEYGGVMSGLGVGNEPNLNGGTVKLRGGSRSHRSTFLTATRGGREVDAAKLYGKIYGRTYDQLKLRGLIGPVDITFGELTSGADVSTGEARGSKLRGDRWPSAWVRDAAAEAANDPTFSGGIARADALSVHPYGHSVQPESPNPKYPWDVFGMAGKVNVGTKSKPRVESSARTVLNDLAKAKTLRKTGGSASRPSLWATEFGYYTSTGTVAKNRSRIHTEAERKLWLVGSDGKSGAFGRLTSSSVNVIGLWSVVEDPPNSIAPGASAVAGGEYGFIGAGVNQGDSSYGPFETFAYVAEKQIFQVKTDRPYGKVVGKQPKRPAKTDPKYSAWERFNGLQQTQPRRVPCAIRKWAGSKAAPATWKLTHQTKPTALPGC